MKFYLFFTGIFLKRAYTFNWIKENLIQGVNCPSHRFTFTKDRSEVMVSFTILVKIALNPINSIISI